MTLTIDDPFSGGSDPGSWVDMLANSPCLNVGEDSHQSAEKIAYLPIKGSVAA